MKRGFTNRHCPKCSGNIFLDKDSCAGVEESCHGWYELCLQCGYTRYLKPETVSTEVLELMPAMKKPALV